LRAKDDTQASGLAARSGREVPDPTPGSPADLTAKVPDEGRGIRGLIGPWISPAAASAVSAALAYKPLRAGTDQISAQQSGSPADGTPVSPLGTCSFGKGPGGASVAAGPEGATLSAGKLAAHGVVSDDRTSGRPRDRVWKDEAEASRPAPPSDGAVGSRRMAKDLEPDVGPRLHVRDLRRTGVAEGRGFEAPVSSALPSGNGPPGSTASPDIPPEARRIAQQVATHPVFRTGGSAEVSLAPEELGHLRLSVEMGDGGLRVVIEAARPETCDLMRRHVEALRQELRQEGLGSVSVSVGGGEGRRGEDQAQGGRQADLWPASGGRATASDPGASDPPLTRPASAAGHLDLRF